MTISTHIHHWHDLRHSGAEDPLGQLPNLFRCCVCGLRKEQDQKPVDIEADIDKAIERVGEAAALGLERLAKELRKGLAR